VIMTEKNKNERSTESFVRICFVVSVMGIGWVLGVLTGPDAWYASLVKPSFNPPNAVFAPVWTVLYFMIAMAGWRVWLRARTSFPMLLWGMQTLLNWMWSPVFFLAHQPGIALIIITMALVSVLLFIILAKKYDKLASWLFVPYALWLVFATIVNASIVWLN